MVVERASGRHVTSVLMHPDLSVASETTQLARKGNASKRLGMQQLLRETWILIHGRHGVFTKPGAGSPGFGTQIDLPVYAKSTCSLMIRVVRRQQLALVCQT